jgi:hypothetical protein
MQLSLERGGYTYFSAEDAYKVAAHKVMADLTAVEYHKKRVWNIIDLKMRNSTFECEYEVKKSMCPYLVKDDDVEIVVNTVEQALKDKGFQVKRLTKSKLGITWCSPVEYKTKKDPEEYESLADRLKRVK